MKMRNDMKNNDYLFLILPQTSAYKTNWLLQTFLAKTKFFPDLMQMAQPASLYGCPNYAVPDFSLTIS